MNYIEEQKKDRARYDKDTSAHSINIIKDDGVFRHIQMKRDGSSIYWFNITTFGGYLVVTGDMGCYTFSRLHDMFEFHRIDFSKERLSISYEYWAEKCEAAGRHNGIWEFDEKGFVSSARECFKTHMKGVKNYRIHYRDFKNEILECGVNNSREATSLMCNWTYTDENFIEQQPFHEFWDYGEFKKPSFNFKWVCWAIASTIKMYDEIKVSK